ncbi:Uncharacterised protein [Mycobacteroides abscessus subsp. abscessus]|nr:Uncharacterised protein [Mycobacteroides abscessus subsp. abscessus]
MVSSSIASTTCSRRSPAKTGASRVLAAASRFTAMINPIPATSPAVCTLGSPLMTAILPKLRRGYC